MEGRVSSHLRVQKTILCYGECEVGTLTQGMTLKLVLFDGVTSLFEVYEGSDYLGIIEITEDDLENHITKGALKAFSSCATIEVICENCGTPSVTEDPPVEWKCSVCGSPAYETTNQY